MALGNAKLKSMRIIMSLEMLWLSPEAKDNRFRNCQIAFSVVESSPNVLIHINSFSSRVNAVFFPYLLLVYIHSRTIIWEKNGVFFINRILLTYIFDLQQIKKKMFCCWFRRRILNIVFHFQCFAQSFSVVYVYLHCIRCTQCACIVVWTFLFSTCYFFLKKKEFNVYVRTTMRRLQDQSKLPNTHQAREKHAKMNCTKCTQ